MKTFHRLLLIGGAMGLLFVASLAAALRQLALGARVDRMRSQAESLRAEILLSAVYGADLVAARQRNDNAAEQESIRLLRGCLRRAGECVAGLEARAAEEDDPAGVLGLPPGDARDLLDLWRRHGEAAEDVISGRAASRSLEALRAGSLGLAQRLGTAAAAAERRRETCRRGAVWTLAVACVVELALIGLALWRLHTDVFAGVERVLENLQLLSSGNLSPEAAALPAGGRGEFGQVTHYLRRFLERLREADRTKDRFLAAMSHEIRTPMTGVIGFLGNLRETPLNEAQRQYLRVIESSARNLLRVINEILDFSKLSAGRVELEEVAFDLTRLAEDSVAMARHLAGSKPVRVLLDINGLGAGVIRGDPTRLRQVLDNLLGNAVKFTDRGEVRLAIEGADLGGGRLEVRVAVSDTGIGIAPEQQRELFQPFRQADAGTTRRYGGTGLGLCIASGLVELMGGRLSVESRPGAGTTFRFAFASRAAPATEQVQVSGHHRITLPPGALGKYWALLVDDTPTTLFLMETICQSIGLPYRTAANGKEAVELARQQRFDLIFMDIQMPIMDGYDAIRAIRALENSGGTQIVALTASAFQEDIEKALGAGSTGFLAKPFERDQLLLCIAQHLDIPVERELREPLEAGDTREEMLLRQMYDFMAEQYRISLGEIKMILAQSVADWRPLLEDLRVFARRGDWEEVRALMHRLKGQLASIGLPLYADRAAMVTAAIRSGQTEGLRAETETFTAELGAVFRAIEQEVTLDLRVEERNAASVAGDRGLPRPG